LLNDINEGRYEQDGYVYEELGELYLLKNETDKSKEYFSKAYEILSKDDWMMKNETSRIDRMFKLSR